MTDLTFAHFIWALTLGAVSAVSLPLGSLLGLRVRFPLPYIAAFAAFGAGALIAALSVELVAPTSMALADAHQGDSDHARTNFLVMIAGGVLGGILFVALDALVNQNGGYVRKSSTTLAHVAAKRRAAIREQLHAVLELPPFNALPPSLTEVLAGMLVSRTYKQNDQLWKKGTDAAEAFLVVDGEVDIIVDGKKGDTASPNALVGLLPLFVPNLANIGTLRAKTAVKCLVLRREDVDELRLLSSEFDQACHTLASERMEKLEHHLVTRLSEAVQWSRSAAEALRRGNEPPPLVLQRTREEHRGSPLAVWLGILLDGIPESFVIGAGLFTVLSNAPSVESLRFLQVIPYTLVAGLFLSNFPEALSSSANMLKVGWNRRRIFLMWFALMITTSIGSGLGFLLAGVLSETWLVFAEGIAAGAMLTMIAAAMIPEAATHGSPNTVGLSTLAGFLAAVMFKLLE